MLIHTLNPRSLVLGGPLSESACVGCRFAQGHGSAADCGGHWLDGLSLFDDAAVLNSLNIDARPPVGARFRTPA
jgi:hypothetical protein